MAKKVDYSAIELKETLIDTKRVSKTVKGGRIARFSALVVVGDGAGHVGYGLGKAAEVPEAIRKAIEAAKRNVIEVSVKGTTIPHEIIGEFGAGRVLLKPASPVPASSPAERCAQFSTARAFAISEGNRCVPITPSTLIGHV